MNNNWYYIGRIIHRIWRCCLKKHIRKNNSVNCNPSDKVNSIISWNIQGLFYYMYDEKIQNILYTLNNMESDVICLQEVFEDDLKEIIIKDLSYKYPYYLLGNRDKKYYLGEDSGLLVLSKYKINFVKEVLLPFIHCTPDKFSNRSVIYFQIGDINLSTTHLQSSNERISEKNIHLMLHESPFQQYILTGDLNHNQAEDIIQVNNNNTIRTWGDNQILDYILPLNIPHTLLTNVIDMNITNISDHWPIRSIIFRE